MLSVIIVFICLFFFFQAEDGIRDLVRSRGLGDVYKRQGKRRTFMALTQETRQEIAAVLGQ